MRLTCRVWVPGAPQAVGALLAVDPKSNGPDDEIWRAEMQSRLGRPTERAALAHWFDDTKNPSKEKDATKEMAC